MIPIGDPAVSVATYEQAHLDDILLFSTNPRRPAADPAPMRVDRTPAQRPLVELGSCILLRGTRSTYGLRQHSLKNKGNNGPQKEACRHRAGGVMGRAETPEGPGRRRGPVPLLAAGGRARP